MLAHWEDVKCTVLAGADGATNGLKSSVRTTCLFRTHSKSHHYMVIQLHISCTRAAKKPGDNLSCKLSTACSGFCLSFQEGLPAHAGVPRPCYTQRPCNMCAAKQALWVQFTLTYTLLSHYGCISHNFLEHPPEHSEQKHTSLRPWEPTLANWRPLGALASVSSLGHCTQSVPSMPTGHWGRHTAAPTREELHGAKHLACVGTQA